MIGQNEGIGWLRSSIDSNGVKTIYPPMPKRDEDIPICSFCAKPTQFLYFFPEVLKHLSDDAGVPSFCSGVCARMFIRIVKQGFSESDLS